MADISAAAVKALRDKTNLPLMDVKRALTEAGGDEAKAIEILKESFKKLAIKRAENTTSEGLVRVLVNEDGSRGVMVELQCESAPVAKAEDFMFLADQCAKQLLNGPGADSPEALLEQTAPDRPGTTLKTLLEEVFNKIREKIVLARVLRVDGNLNGYAHHDGKTGVLMIVDGAKKGEAVVKDVAMHIAALRPAVALPEELDAGGIATERQRLTAEAAASGKPENIIEKMVDGKMKVYYAEQGVLAFQAFAKDDSKTVSQALAEHGLKPVRFVRWMLGN